MIHYIKCIMPSKSSKLELGFVHYITKFTISRFECISISKYRKKWGKYIFIYLLFSRELR